MRAAVDSSILLDILLDDPHHARTSLELLERHAGLGSLIVCPVVYAETAATFAPPAKFEAIACDIGLDYDEFPREATILAASLWQEYRRRGGPRRRILPDFLIGAHAQVRADVLLTRDRGYYRDYFSGLRIESP